MTVDINAHLCPGFSQVMTKPLRPLWVSQSSRIWLDQVREDDVSAVILRQCIFSRSSWNTCLALLLVSA